MADQQLIDEVVSYLTKDGAVMDIARARQGAKLIRRQHSRIEADEALMLKTIEAIEDRSINRLILQRLVITALRTRLEKTP